MDNTDFTFADYEQYDDEMYDFWNDLQEREERDFDNEFFFSNTDV